MELFPKGESWFGGTLGGPWGFLMFLALCQLEYPALAAVSLSACALLTLRRQTGQLEPHPRLCIRQSSPEQVEPMLRRDLEYQENHRTLRQILNLGSGPTNPPFVPFANQRFRTVIQLLNGFTDLKPNAAGSQGKIVPDSSGKK